jgi:two-component system nitrate/nitrite response regulator NarL
MSGAGVEHTIAEQDNFSGYSPLIRKNFTANIICSNPILGLGLRNILSNSCFSIAAVAGYNHVPSLSFSQEKTSLFVIDWCGAQPSVIDYIKTIKTRYPEVKIAVVADQFSLEAVKAGLDLGVEGFCLASSPPEVLVKSLELVMLQEVVVPSAMVRAVIDVTSDYSSETSQESATEAKPVDPRARKLSAREAEILGCLMEGSPNKVIARKLDVTEATVKVHIKAILRKIGAANRTQAAIWATDHLQARAEPRLNG